MAIRHALVVDDSKSAGLMLRRMLEQHSVAVDTAESAEAAIDYLRNQHPDVVFMDHIMPGMNGLEAAKTISANPQTATIPIVMYTSTEGEAYVQKAKAHGAVGILPKPPKADVLARFVRELNGADSPAARTADITTKPSAASAPAAPAAPVPTETIEDIARRAAEAVAQNTVQSLVTRVLQEQLSELRQDLVARCEEVARQVSVELAQTQGGELETLLKEHLQDQLADMQGHMNGATTLDTALLEEVSKVARSVAIRDAAEVATGTAQKVAMQTARDVAMHTAGETARQTANDLYAARANALSDQLRSYVRDRLAEANLHPMEPVVPAPAMLDEIKSLARSVATEEAAAVAAHTAQAIVDHSAHDAAAHAAESIATRAADETARRITGELEAAQAARVGALAEEVRRQEQLRRRIDEQLVAMHEQLANMQALLTQPIALPEPVREELHNMVQSVATETATKVAAAGHQKTLSTPPQDLARQAANHAVRLLESALIKAERSQLRRMYALAGGAALIGVIAAVVGFWLR